MPIDRDKALGYAPPEGEGGYGQDDVILYHLGVGAGASPTDPGELAYTYEKSLKVLPSFASVAPTGARSGLRAVPGLEFDPALLLHGEQEIELHRPLPPAARLRGQARIADIYDKGKAAFVVWETTARDDTGPLFTNRVGLFLRGEGGCGGPSGPKAGNVPPERAPDGVLHARTLPQQALLYRLCGDKNPLHADPAFAARGGFDRPILHGLCSYGIACKAIVDGVLGGDPGRVARYQARFRGVVFPGETFEIAWWREGAQILLEARCKERRAPILSNAVIEVRD